jgi:hypothetical protein
VDFWAKYSESDPEGDSERIQYNWIKIIKMLKNLRKMMDDTDAQRVR